MNLVEMIADDQHSSPCRFGNIVGGYACYCHHAAGPRKCPVWLRYGEHSDKWHTNGDWNEDGWDGGCKMFIANTSASRSRRDRSGMNRTAQDSVRCTLCGTDGQTKDAKFLPLYVIGSEGVIACMECRIALTDCAKHLMRVAGKCRMDGYKACKQVHTPNAPGERSGASPDTLRPACSANDGGPE